VANERFAARRFAHVYGMLVQMPATYLEPGEVILQGGPTFGVLDAGRYPRGMDARIEQVCADLTASGFAAQPDPAIMRLKYAKLLHNLGNAVPVVCNADTGRALVHAIRAEADAVYRAAAIDCAPTPEFAARVALCETVDVPGAPRIATSTMQSLLRGRTSVETDYLNGEITLLGALHGVPTPVNRVLQDLSAEFASSGRTPGSMTVDAVLELARTRGAAFPAA